MRTTNTLIGAAFGAALLLAPSMASAGHVRDVDCFQRVADMIKAKMAHIDATIDRIHAAKMSRVHHVAAAPAPKKPAHAPMK
ncbi:MAG: hypothetical protein ABL898_16690 [Hyphomicrobiaceae bacterium]|nr:hypothetical protein [Hyphomicrobiaceae bacterium]